MEDDVGEIECLDEDYDVVQEYVSQSMQLSPPATPKSKSRRKTIHVHRNISKLERRTPSPPPPHWKNRPRYSDGKFGPNNTFVVSLPNKVTYKQVPPNAGPRKIPPSRAKHQPINLVKQRFESEIVMHDFEDPLCLPVKMLQPNAHDRSRLNAWNEKCLKNLFLDNPKTDNIESSKRVITLKKTKETDKRAPEVSVSTKITLKSVDGKVKNEETNVILPKFEEKATVDFEFSKNGYGLILKETSTVILNKEAMGDREKLVAYHVEDGIQAVFDMFDKPEEELKKKNGLGKRVLKEVAVVGACVSCYQQSWRPNCDLKLKGNFTCLICQRKFNSVYNYMSHAKLNHKAREIGEHKMEISTLLAKTINYLYKCRICRKNFRTITKLRSHIKTHKALKEIKCDIGDHLV